LREALEPFTLHDPLKAKLLELRCCCGPTRLPAAESLGVSPATADRAWRYARAWLHTARADGGLGEK
jgi:hypothetical protein